MIAPRSYGKGMAWGALVAALVTGASACGADTAVGAHPQDAAKTSSAGHEARGTSGNKLTVTAIEYGYQLKGHPRPGRVDITFDNTGDEAHEMSIAKVKDGTTKAQLVKAFGQGEEAAMAYLDGDPEQSFGTPSLIFGGHSAEAISDELPAGTYAVLCFLPGPDGMPHVAMGMIDVVQITGKAVDRAPKTDGTVALTDSGITLPAGFDGTGTYEIANTGTAPHSFSIGALPDGVTLDALYQYVGSHLGMGQNIDGAPADLVSGVTALSPGRSSYLVLDLPAGHYGYVSTEGDSPDPTTSDYGKGLHGEFDVN